MSKRQKSWIARLAISAAVLLAGCTTLTPIDLTGGWVGEIVWTDGPAAGFRQEFTMDLVHDGSNLTGTVTLPSHAMQTFDLPVTFGRTRGHTVEVEATGTNDRLTPPVAVYFTLEGDFDSTTMSGTGTQTAQGATYHFTWSAVLAYPPVEEP